MRLTIAKSELQDALKAVSSTVGKGGMTALQRARYSRRWERP